MVRISKPQLNLLHSFSPQTHDVGCKAEEQRRHVKKGTKRAPNTVRSDVRDSISYRAANIALGETRRGARAAGTKQAAPSAVRDQAAGVETAGKSCAEHSED